MGHHDHVSLLVTDVLPALVSHLRSADGQGRWRLERHPESAPVALEIRFESVPDVLGELEQRVQHAAARLGLSVEVSRTGADGSGVSAALSELASELALKVLGGGPLDRAEQVSTAALHLRLLTELTPPGNRPAFLFLNWQHWSRTLGPALRVELHEQAEKLAPALLAGTVETARDHRHRPAWTEYGRALRTTVADHAAAGRPALAYELFDHAHHTHLRLGITVAAEAVAARALRSALAAADPADTSTALEAVLAAAPLAI
ncbi:hypothetical protein [Streptomyces sp. MAR4 CNX-425]|uniref:hypothetical protein n=1 Tax=Streptomyces sp. MAR4 CNX-425 TaxID=3406343 RepID=UPI003B5006BC